MKLILFILIDVLFLLSPLQLFALTPQEIVIVFNKNMPQSREIAEYYAKQRAVPAQNIIGLNLPVSETMSREAYEYDLALPLKQTINQFKASGLQPIILLVYGVPLKINPVIPKNSKTTKKFASQKIAELSNNIRSLIPRLELLTFGTKTQGDKKGDNTLELILLAEKSVKKVLQINLPSWPRPNQVQMEIHSLLLRLAGISPFAEGLIKQGVTEQRLNELRKDSLIKWNGILKNQLNRHLFFGVPKKNNWDAASIVRISDGIIGELRFWYNQEKSTHNNNTSASVDNELTLLTVHSYSKANWLQNPFQTKFNRLPNIAEIRNELVMTARIDGPLPQIVYQLIDHSLYAEEHGLEGVFYIDARGIDKKKDNYYSIYDKHLANLAQILKNNSSLKVVFDNKQTLFAKKACPDAALYCGWYSLGKYIDSFQWQKGAIGFHVASAEASTLRSKNSTVWCKRMLEQGIAATLGPVSEPYLQSFPLPDLFFPLLLSGKLPLIEVYFRSLPFISWQQLLIGDPLYTPFSKNPAIVY